jgi:hypothetical protein
MELEIAVLTDAFNMSVDGKLNLLGVFTRIFAPSAPAIHPMMFVVTQFVAAPTERGSNQNIRFTLIDEDGKQLFTSGEIAAVVPDNPNDLNPVLNIVAGIGGVTFQNFGRYGLHILVNGTHVKTLPLIFDPVRQPPNMMPG